MEKDTLYKFFDGKASQEEKKAVRAWLEATPQNEKGFSGNANFSMR